VVDGGYFENSGQTTAHDLASALRKIGLSPIVMSIANGVSHNPALGAAKEGMTHCTVFDGPSCKPTQRLGLETAQASGFAFRALSSVLGPVEALIGTRDSHGELSGVNLSRDLNEWEVKRHGGGPLTDAEATLFPVRVYEEGEYVDAKGHASKFSTADLSMSWWLSPLVRSALDYQLDGPENRMQLCLLRYRLANPDPAVEPPPCVKKPRL